MSGKIITVREETWEALMQIKIALRKKSMDATIRMALDRAGLIRKK